MSKRVSFSDRCNCNNCYCELRCTTCQCNDCPCGYAHLSPNPVERDERFETSGGGCLCEERGCYELRKIRE